MHLVDNGTEKIDIILTKVEESKEEDPEWSSISFHSRNPEDVIG